MHAPPSLLVVDDSRTSRTLIRAIVSQLRPEWRIAEVASGEEALALIAEEQPDYISMDVNMPGMGGLEAAGRIRLKYPDIRIVLCTANIQDSVRQAAAKAGVHFVSKPITPQSVGQAISHFEGAACN